MPDHLHILATGLTDAADMTAFMKQAKQQSGWEYRQATRCYLWQEGFYDHVLRDEDAPPAVIRYIIDNPLRAGLVGSPSEYPFWGSQIYSREEVLEFVQFVEPWIPPWKRSRV